MSFEFDQFDPTVLDQAFAWVARLRSDSVDQTDEQDFALWLSVKKEHQAAFDEAMVLWESMGVAATTLADVAADPFLSKVEHPRLEASNQAVIPDPSPVQDNPSRPAKTQSDSHRQYFGNSLINRNTFFAIAAGIVLMIVAGTSFFNKVFDDKNTFSSQLYATIKGQQQQFVLPDNSVIELNTQSRITVSYSNRERRLELLEGEVYFDVAKDAERPFVVHVGNTNITAVGTAFNINRQQQSILIAVTEGTVTVEESDSDSFDNKGIKDAAESSGLQSGKSNAVSAGEQVLFDSRGFHAKTEANLEAITAWRNKTLVFRNVSLSSALEELNRYLKKPVDISDPSLVSLRISGTFSVAEPEDTLQAIIASFGLQTAEVGNREKLRLYR